MKRILFVETQQAVHSVGYFNSILLRVRDNETVEIAVAHPEKHGYLGNILGSIALPSRVNRFLFHEGPPPSAGRLGTYWIALGALIQLRKIIRQWKPDRIVFLRLDFVLPWMFPPTRQWLFDSCEVSGIYFGGDEFRIHTRTRLKHRIRYFMERKLVLFALAQNVLRSMLCLDHSLPRRIQLLEGIDTTKLQPSADPWLPFNKKTSTESLKELGLALKQPIVLSLGVQSKRKGTSQLLESLGYLEPGSFTLLIVGPLRPDVSKEVTALVKKRREEGWQIIVIDRFIADDETWTFLQAASFVVCPYVDFLQSSNVMIRACAAGKPVLVSKGGVMEDAVTRFGCGIAVDTTPAAIAQGIRELLCLIKKNPDSFSEGCRKYAELHTAQRFFDQFL